MALIQSAQLDSFNVRCSTWTMSVPAPPWSAAAWRRFHVNSARSARDQSGARPPHSKEARRVNLGRGFYETHLFDALDHGYAKLRGVECVSRPCEILNVQGALVR